MRFWSRSAEYASCESLRPGKGLTAGRPVTGTARETKMRFGFMHLTLLLACGSLGIAAQTTPSPSPNATDNGPTFRATSRLVLVDVVVTGKRGEFIRDLKPADFTILENGKSVKISGFSAHAEAPSDTPTQKLQLPPNVYTNFTAPQPGHPITIVLLDMLNTEYLERAYARQQMLKFLSSMPEGQPIALFVLGSKLRMLQGFTQSSDALVAAAKRILDKDENARLHTSEQEVSDASAMDAMLATYAGRSPASAVSIADALRDEQAAQTDVRIFSTLRSLQALGTMVAGYGGRKNLIWLSSDFPITFGPGFDLAFTAAPGGRHGANSNLYVDELHNTSRCSPLRKLRFIQSVFGAWPPRVLVHRTWGRLRVSLSRLWRVGARRPPWMTLPEKPAERLFTIRMTCGA